MNELELEEYNERDQYTRSATNAIIKAPNIFFELHLTESVPSRNDHNTGIKVCMTL